MNAVSLSAETLQSIDSWEPYLKHGKRMFKKNKSIVFRQGEQGAGIYYVYKGMVKIVTYSADGTERILDIKGSGQLIGEQAINNQSYFSTAIAADDAVLYYFSNPSFKELLITSPNLFTLFANSMVDKIKLLADGLVLSDYGAEYRIASRLLKVREACNTDKITITQQDLANYTGLTRITIYKTLKKWKEEKLIHVKGKTITILHLHNFTKLLDQ